MAREPSRRHPRPRDRGRGAVRARPTGEARRLAGRAMERADGSLDPVFAGMQRSSIWPVESGIGERPGRRPVRRPPSGSGPFGRCPAGGRSGGPVPGAARGAAGDRRPTHAPARSRRARRSSRGGPSLWGDDADRHAGRRRRRPRPDAAVPSRPRRARRGSSRRGGDRPDPRPPRVAGPGARRCSTCLPAGASRSSPSSAATPSGSSAARSRRCTIMPSPAGQQARRPCGRPARRRTTPPPVMPPNPRRRTLEPGRQTRRHRTDVIDLRPGGLVNERTLVLIKPDGVQRLLTGRILARYEDRGLKLVGLKLIHVHGRPRRAPLRGSPREAVLPGPGRLHHSAPLVAAVLEGPNAIAVVRAMNGATRPHEAAPGSIRGDFALETAAEPGPCVRQPGERRGRDRAVVRGRRAPRLRPRDRSLGARAGRVERSRRRGAELSLRKASPASGRHSARATRMGSMTTMATATGRSAGM